MPEVLADLTSPPGDEVRRGLPESSIIAQLGQLAGDSRHRGGGKESDGGPCPRILSGMGSRRRRGPLPKLSPRPHRPTHACCARRRNNSSREAQQKLGKLVNEGWHATHTASLGKLPETAHPPGPSDSLGGIETKAFAKARDWSL